MRKGTRPSAHLRRIKTRRGRKVRVINAHIKKRPSVTVRYPSKLPEGVKQAQAREVTRAYIGEVVSTLKRGSSVRVPELGVIKIKRIPARPARKGVNPFTKKEQTFKAKPASKKVKFIASKSVREAIK